MKMLSVALVICLISGWSSGSTLTLDKKIQDGASVAFLTFAEPSQWGSWLQMNLPFEPMVNLKKQVEQIEGVTLKTRGEAHITVVTPVEYWNILKSKISIEEINRIAEQMDIQNSTFEIVCLGRGQLNLAKTYFVVVTSEDLTNIRKAVQNAFISKGGSPTVFDPLNFYPHITLGFTDRDLHESDGVVKGSNSCVYPLD